MRPRALLIAVTLAGAAAGCRSPSPESVSPENQAFVEVQNQGFQDLTIYILRGSTRVRLGSVTGNTTTTFQIPRQYVNPGLAIRFLADPIGSRTTPYSEEIPVWPGDRIVLRIPPS